MADKSNIIKDFTFSNKPKDIVKLNFLKKDFKNKCLCVQEDRFSFS